MKKNLGLIILTSVILTACQLPNPTIYTYKPQVTEMSDINEIKQAYQYDMIDKQQQAKLNDLEHQMAILSSDQKQEKLIVLYKQYHEIYHQNHQQNIDDFEELINMLASVDIRKLPEEIRQQYIMSGETITNFAQLEKFNESIPTLQTIKMINDTYHLNISHHLLNK